MVYIIIVNKGITDIMKGAGMQMIPKETVIQQGLHPHPGPSTRKVRLTEKKRPGKEEEDYGEEAQDNSQSRRNRAGKREAQHNTTAHPRFSAQASAQPLASQAFSQALPPKPS